MTEFRLSTPPGVEYRKTTSAPRATKTRAAAGGGPVIAGYGAVFFNPADPDGTQYELWTDTIERIDPGAFDETLKNDNIRALFNHEPSFLLGTTQAGSLRLSVDSVGLRYEISPADTLVASDVFAWIEAGELTGSSISFLVEGEEWQAGGDGEPDIRIIKRAKLFDVGPVTFPAFTATTAGVKQSTCKSRSRFSLPTAMPGEIIPGSVRDESNRIFATLNRRRREIDLLKLVGGVA